MALQIRKASRNMTFMKCLLTGPSGCGKSYGSLVLAQGMLKEMPDLGGNSKRIGYIGTESVRDELYADQFDYDIISLPEDQRNLDMYTEAFNAFMQAGYGIIIIDSLTHLWNWVQDKVREEEQTSRNKNGVTIWGKWKKENKKFQDLILFSDVHVIATARGKDEYVMEQNDKGKMEIRKVGVGSQQDKDTEYEFMVSLLIDQKTHYAQATKDNTHLWDGDNVSHPVRIITEKDGEDIMKWCMNGTSKEDKEAINNLRIKIADLGREKGGTQNAPFMVEWRRLMNGRSLEKLDDKAELEAVYEALAKTPSLEEAKALEEKAKKAKEKASKGKEEKADE